MFAVCTCNDISNLPPEFARAEETVILVEELPPVRLPDTGLPSHSLPVRAKQPSAADDRASLVAAGLLLLLATCCLCCAVPSLLQQTLSNLFGTVFRAGGIREIRERFGLPAEDGKFPFSCK